MTTRTKFMHYTKIYADAALKSFWRVATEKANAKVRIHIDADLFDAALKRSKNGRGVGLDCVLSWIITLACERNKRLFPHAMLMPYVVNSRVFVIDKKNKRNEPSHAVQYAHDLGWLVDLFDMGSAHGIGAVRDLLSRGPILFSLRKVPVSKPHVSNGRANDNNPTRRHVIGSGAQRRARHAGFALPKAA